MHNGGKKELKLGSGNIITEDIHLPEKGFSKFGF